MSVTRTPTASRTALDSAGGTGFVGTSATDFAPKGPVGSGGLDEDGLDRRRLGGRREAVLLVGRHLRASLVVEGDPLADGHLVAHVVGALDLPGRHSGVYRDATVDGDDEFVHLELAGPLVDGHVRELRGKGRRALLGAVGPLPEDVLAFLVAVGGLVAHVLEGDGLAGRLAVDGSLGGVEGVDGFLEQFRPPLEDAFLGVLGGLLDGHAADVGRRGGVGAVVEGRHVGVGGLDDDVFFRTAQHLGGDLDEGGVRARPDVDAADVQVEGAVLVHHHLRGAEFVARDAGALCRQRHPQPAMEVVLVGLVSVVPADSFLAALDALVEATGADAALGALTAHHARDLVEVARLHVVVPAELDGVESHLVGDLVEVALERERALRGAVATHRARLWRVRVDHVGREVDVRDLRVQRERLAPDVAGDGHAVTAVGAGVGERRYLDGLEVAVVGDGSLGPNLHRVPGAHRSELLVATGLVDNRASGR